MVTFSEAKDYIKPLIQSNFIIIKKNLSGKQNASVVLNGLQIDHKT